MLYKASDTVAIVKPYDRSRKFSSPCFEDFIEDDVRRTYDINGNAVYTKVGEIDVREYVSSFVDGCSLSSILSRIGLLPVNEKLNYLRQENSVDGDFSFLPQDLTDAIIKIKDVDSKFPGVLARCSNGEKVEDVLKDVLKVKEVSIENNFKTHVKVDEKEGE